MNPQVSEGRCRWLSLRPGTIGILPQAWVTLRLVRGDRVMVISILTSLSISPVNLKLKQFLFSRFVIRHFRSIQS
jgi:hypothetical protein